MAPLRVLAADELGFVRSIEAKDIAAVADLEAKDRWGEASVANAADCVALAIAGGEWAAEAPALLAIGRSTGSIDLVCAHSGRVLSPPLPPPPAAAGAGEHALAAAARRAAGGDPSGKPPPSLPPTPPSACAGLGFLYHTAGTGAKHLPLLVTAAAGGAVRVFAPPAPLAALLGAKDGDDGEGPTTQPTTQPASAPWTLVAKFTAPPHITALATDPSTPASTRIALAFQGSEAAVWCVGARAATFEARGPKADSLGLVERPWGTAVAFLPGHGGHLLAVGTVTGRVRLYDPRHGKRPLAVVVVAAGAAGHTAVGATPASISTLAPDPAHPHWGRVWVGDARGLLRCVDLRAKRVEGVLKGPTGAIRAAAVHPTQRLVASVGLDGWVRVHHAETRVQLGSAYLKQPLTGVAFCPAPPGSGAGPEPALPTPDAKALKKLKKRERTTPIAGEVFLKRSRREKKLEKRKKNKKKAAAKAGGVGAGGGGRRREKGNEDLVT